MRVSRTIFGVGLISRRESERERPNEKNTTPLADVLFFTPVHLRWCGELKITMGNTRRISLTTAHAPEKRRVYTLLQFYAEKSVIQPDSIRCNSGDEIIQ